MMKKKLIAMVAALSLVGCVGVGSTLAYLTDSDKATNTFTVGNVKIDLIESQLHRSNASGQKSQDTPSMVEYLVAGDEYSAAHGWTQKYYPDAVIKADAKEYKAEGGYFESVSKNIVPGTSIRKCPYVVNTGKNPAYVRVRAYIPANLDPADNGILGNSSYWCTTAWKSGEFIINGVAASEENAYSKVVANIKKATIENVEYSVMEFTYLEALEPGAMTFWQCWNNIQIDKKTTSEQLEGIEQFDVIFEADAIQAEGFEDAVSAFAAFAEQNK